MRVSVLGSVSACALTAIIAGAFLLAPNFSEKVVASAPLHSGKGDRLDIKVSGGRCAQQAWPYLESGCIRDRRAPLGKLTPTRVVSAGRR